MGSTLGGDRLLNYCITVLLSLELAMFIVYSASGSTKFEARPDPIQGSTFYIDFTVPRFPEPAWRIMRKERKK
jgi:hypothetical protein